MTGGAAGRMAASAAARPGSRLGNPVKDALRPQRPLVQREVQTCRVQSCAPFSPVRAPQR